MARKNDDDNVVDLAGAAADAADPGQAELDGTNYPVVKFKGVAYSGADVEDVKLGEEVEFVVRGRVDFIGEELMATGNARKLRRVKVTDVIRK